jgi:hypothetical protein
MRYRGPVHPQRPHMLQPVCGAVLGIDRIVERGGTGGWTSPTAGALGPPDKTEEGRERLHSTSWPSTLPYREGAKRGIIPFTKGRPCAGDRPTRVGASLAPLKLIAAVLNSVTEAQRVLDAPAAAGWVCVPRIPKECLT